MIIHKKFGKGEVINKTPKEMGAKSNRTTINALYRFNEMVNG